MRVRHPLLVAGFICLGVSGRAQDAAAPTPAFDVASLKPVEPTFGTYQANLGSARNGQVALSNVTLSDCLKFAYSITNDSQIAGPDWMSDRQFRFNVQAKSAPDTPREQLLQMLQTLLIDRFQMKLHHEQRDLSFLALVIATKGSKLREADSGSPVSNTLGLGRIDANRLTMPVLTLLLSRFLRQPVLDKTELKGMYVVRLEWTPESHSLRSAASDSGDADAATSPGASVYTALQEQLGLKLESRKGPLDVLVVDQALKVPIEN